MATKSKRKTSSSSKCKVNVVLNTGEVLVYTNISNVDISDGIATVLSSANKWLLKVPVVNVLYIRAIAPDAMYHVNHAVNEHDI